MEKKEELKLKEEKILKCEKCGKEYVFDSISQKCPECGGTLKKVTVGGEKIILECPGGGNRTTMIWLLLVLGIVLLGVVILVGLIIIVEMMRRN